MTVQVSFSVEICIVAVKSVEQKKEWSTIRRSHSRQYAPPTAEDFPSPKTDDRSKIKSSNKALPESSKFLADYAVTGTGLHHGDYNQPNVHREQNVTSLYQSILDSDSITTQEIPANWSASNSKSTNKHAVDSVSFLQSSHSSLEEDHMKRSAESELADSKYVDSEDLFPVHPAVPLMSLNKQSKDNGHFIPEESDR